MDHARNLLFFNHKRTKRWTFVTYISYAFIVAAVLVFIIVGWLPMALPFAVVGVALLLTALNMMTGEKQIKEQIGVLQKSAEELAMAHFEHPDKNPDLFFEFEGYDLTDPSLTLRKKKNGRVFSTSYVITYMMIRNKTLRIWQRSSSLTEEKETVFTKDIPLASLLGAEIIRESIKRECCDGKEQDIPLVAIRVKDSEKGDVCTVFCKIFDYDVERFVETLTHNIQRAKQ